MTQGTSTAEAVREMVTKVTRCLITPDIDPGTVGMDSDLRQDLGFQSLMLVELGFALQDLYDVSVDSEEVLGVRTVGDVRDVILRQLDAGAARLPADEEVRDWLESYGYGTDTE
jgi:acyl carrier protein